MKGELPMTIRDGAGKLAMASMFALVVLSVPTGLVHAANTDPRAAECKARGFAWDDKTKRCADTPCPGGQPGDVRVLETWGGQRWEFCNGFTGKWETLRTAQPQLISSHASGGTSTSNTMAP